MTNFDEIVNRRGTACVKWDEDNSRPNLIPLWVADMDFKAAPEIINALRRRVDNGVFGYTHVPDEYYDAVINWFSRRHNWLIQRSSIIYTTGVVPALSAIIKAFTNPGDHVIIQPPVYNCFFSSIKNNACHLVANPLTYKDNTYTIDFEHLEQCCADPRARLMILCNPHNPAGRVWTVDELRRVDDIAKRHNVLVVSDEIHCELVYPPHQYTPYATVATQPWVACVSPSKAFNTAGLHIANIVCSDSSLYAKVDRAINDNEVCDVNPFGVDGLIAAYNKSEDWLDQLLPYIHANYQWLCDTIHRQLPHAAILPLEGTYLAWVNVKHYANNVVRLTEYLKDDANVWVLPGTMYGEQGEGFIRINLACPRAILQQAIPPMLQSILRYQD